MPSRAVPRSMFSPTAPSPWASRASSSRRYSAGALCPGVLRRRQRRAGLQCHARGDAAAKVLGKLLAAHCEDNTPAARRLHPRRRIRATRTATGASARESEWGPIARDLAAGGGDGLRLPRLPRLHEGERCAHPPGEGASGVDVTCETAPHYLSCDDATLAGGRPLQDEPAHAQRATTGGALIEGICATARST